MITSVFFSNEKLQVVVGAVSGKKITVKDYFTAPISEGCILNGVITNDYALKRQLADLFARYKIPKGDINLIIDCNSILTKSVVVPTTTHENILKIVKGEFIEVENYEELIYDYFVLNPRLENGGAVVLGCAADKTFIATYVELFEQIKGAKISSINLALNCEIKLLRFLPETREKTLIVGVLDKNNLNLSLFVGGVFKFTSHTRLFDERGTQASSDEISRAMSSMMQFASSQKYGSEISAAYMCGLADNEIRLCSALESALGLREVRVFPSYDDIVVNKSQQPMARMSIADCMYCIGNLIRL